MLKGFDEHFFPQKKPVEKTQMKKTKRKNKIGSTFFPHSEIGMVAPLAKVKSSLLQKKKNRKLVFPVS